MGTVGNCRNGFIVNRPCSISYRFDMIINKSEQVLTGRKRLRGTLIPMKGTRKRKKTDTLHLSQISIIFIPSKNKC